MQLASPDIKVSRSTLADWIELLALVNRDRRIGRAPLDSLFRFTSEERDVRLTRDFLSGEREDGEIVESDLEKLIAEVLQEIEWRQSRLGSIYPFNLTRVPGETSAWFLAGPQTHETTHAVYLTCLLIVAYRRDLLVPSPNQTNLFADHKIGMIFQICACLALGGFVDGEVVSFGWPRAEGDAFLPALRRVWQRYGAYKIVAQLPDGAPGRLKDGGIDIIAWRGFADDRPSRLLVFGQAASGDNWVEKSAAEPAGVLLAFWFNGASPKWFLPATLMPFVAHEEIEVETTENFERSVHGRMEFHEIRHGLVFDRIRVATSADRAIRSSACRSGTIDGIDRLPELSSWILGVLSDPNSNKGFSAA